MIFEYVKNGDLHQLLKQYESFDEPTARIFFYRDIVDGLATCHERGLVHRDVKFDNILVDASLS